MSELLTIPEVTQLKNNILDQVEVNAGRWMDTALHTLEQLLQTDPTVPEVFTGEWIRLKLTDLVGKPHHHNAWGALVRAAAHRNSIEQLNEWVPMQTAKSHGRQTPLYRSRLTYQQFSGKILKTWQEQQ
jgi:hypothetical protein